MQVKSSHIYITLVFLIAATACSDDISRYTSFFRYENKDYFERTQQYILAANYDSAIIYLNHTLALTDTSKYQDLAQIYNLKSTVSGKLSMFDNAMEYALKALQISEQHQLFEIEVQALLNIGNINYMMYNDAQAEEFMLKAKTIAEENNLLHVVMPIYGQLGELYKATERFDEALSMLAAALKIAKNQSDTLNQIVYLRMIGDYYISLNRYTNPVIAEYQQTAKIYLDEAMNLALKKNVSAYEIQIYTCLIRWARVETNYTKALEYAQKVLKSAANNDYSMLLQIYDHLVAIYAYLGNAEMVIQSQQNFRTLMLKQSDMNLHRSIQEMSTKYETAKKELEIVQQKAEIKRQKTLQYIYTLILIAAGLLIASFIYILIQRAKRNRELKDINALKDKFFAIISHDLKNPAIAQRNALLSITKSASQLEPEMLSQYHAELLKSADYQVELLYNLLNWAQVQTGRMPYKPTAFDIVATVGSEIAMIQNMAKAKNIDIKTQMPDNAIIAGDRNMIITVIRNLLTNAVKFTGNGGNVTLEISLSSDISNSARTCVISVSDTGVGMSVEEIQNLSRIDKQQSKTGTAGEHGSGLGLIVCMEFVEKHGSILYAESNEGKGSRFWFELKCT